MEQDTGKFRTNTKDQYYTKLAVAKDCVDCIIVCIVFYSVVLACLRFYISYAKLMNVL